MLPSVVRRETGSGRQQDYGQGSAGAVDVALTLAGSENTIMAEFKGMLADGQDTFSWQTAGDDGTPRRGDFNFSVPMAH
jgi:hypothetical protein